MAKTKHPSVTGKSYIPEEVVGVTDLAVVRSTDGGLELVLHPGSIELRLEKSTAEEFDKAADEYGQAIKFPVLKQLRAIAAFLGKTLGHHVCDTFWEVPLEAVTEVRWQDGKLEVLSSAGNHLTGEYGLAMGSFDRKWKLDEPGLFPEDDAQALISRFAETKPLFDEYVAKIRK